VYVEVQWDVELVTSVRVQVGVPNVPLVLGENVTVPVGKDAVPVSVSLTSAVHVVVELIAIEVGLHVTAVVVERVVTLMLAGEAVLVAWAPSPP
jgi:hypothetical protein